MSKIPISDADNVISSPNSLLETLLNPTILIDLDDTLLTNGMDTFIPAYMRGFANALSQFVSMDKTIAALGNSINEMMANQLPDQTLLQVFEDYFYPTLEIPAEGGRAAIDHFYQTEYRTLQHLTHRRPDAIDLVNNCLDRGWPVVIATNPLFSETGIVQRLEWAGLSPRTHPFSMITSIENTHFSKPNPAYYAEILATLGWPDGPVLMIGNDFDMDIAPARKLGLATFWVDPDPATPTPPKDLPHPSHNQGTLTQAWEWLVSGGLDSFEPTYETGIAATGVLQATSAVLDPSRFNLPKEKWNHSPGAGEWTLSEIVCHMRDVEREVNLPRLKSILSENNPFLTGIDTNEWAAHNDYSGQAGLPALREFTQTRNESLKILTQLSAEEWSRPARHAIFGPTTLEEIIIFMANHDRVHIRQIRKAINGES